jgi:bacterioferritin-associated ferredoxin
MAALTQHRGAAVAGEDGVVILCHCGVVSDQAISLAADNGAGTVAQVCAATGAGRGCGSCVFTVKRLLSQRVELARSTRAS